MHTKFVCWRYALQVRGEEEIQGVGKRDLTRGVCAPSSKVAWNFLYFSILSKIKEGDCPPCPCLTTPLVLSLFLSYIRIVNVLCLSEDFLMETEFSIEIDSILFFLSTTFDKVTALRLPKRQPQKVS